MYVHRFDMRPSDLVIQFNVFTLELFTIFNIALYRVIALNMNNNKF